MAADVLSRAGVAVQVFDASASAGRKFLLAGRGGLNLTHGEPLVPFMGRFRQGEGDEGAADAVAGWLRDFGPDAVRAWAAALGVETFVGSSGRVFPTEMKAAPLLRAWLLRLRQPQAGSGAADEPGAVPVRLFMRHRWVGWAPEGGANVAAGGPDAAAGNAFSPPGAGALCFDTPTGPVTVRPRATVLALGGASWPRLGSDGAWVPWLTQAGATVAPLVPANCGFDVAARGGPLLAKPFPAGSLLAGPSANAAAGQATSTATDTGSPAPGGWSPYLAERGAGQPLKNVVLSFTDSRGRRFERRGEFVLTATGVEGSLIYAASSLLRDEVARHGHATFHLNLLPTRTPAQVLAEVARPRGGRSLSSHLKGRLGLTAVHLALLHERLPPEALKDPQAVAQALVALPITVCAPRPVAEAISTAGGVRFEALTDDLALRSRPDVFCAGEMLDWEAPTGGYLLTAALASGVRAGHGVLRRLARDGRTG
ncbi:aminoacetone oxidase family FAD-binding enzyme [Comamonas serinivorans]|uniref:Aminoacetone oxidase family FAD-binding enzyme n=1 Tax=Comamonas serinivorans TaxID=1082851 RepID=A0A1Y0ET64_9BURK|nr:NAD(P)/FAD-dependent oxidoreductase [Comamonas serinivorans]ARU06571.1 aminoacetone oxidase family FAD-binding enzyme [Comamonas serinivorans]